MTSTEVRDRFAGMIQVDRSPDSYTDYSNPVDGIWATTTTYTWCRENSAGGEHGVCSRPAGHPGQHVSSSSSRIMAIWGEATPAAALEPDPLGPVQANTRTLEISGWNNATFGCYQENTGRWCREPAPGGAFCSRPAGHPTHWNHIAATSVTVLTVWGPNVDKWANIRPGDYVSDHRGGLDPTTGFRVTESDWCRRVNPDHDNNSVVCTRHAGHFGQHISTAGTGRVRWVMANTDLVGAPQPVEPVDPEDGSPADDESLVFTTAPEIGNVVKLRDRVNRLYVMGVRATTSEVEALDLTRNELRAVPFDRCVRIADESAVMLSLDELEQVAKWYSSHRDTVRRVAVREYRADRWCMDGLNRNLRTLGLSTYSPTLRGSIIVSVPFEHPDPHVDTDSIQRQVKEALSNPEVAAAMRVALPIVDGVELNPDGLTVTSGNYVRK